MDELSLRSASDCLSALRKREVSSLELVDASIARIEALNPELNAVVATDYDRARDKARAADAARANGNALGALHGLPMTIKDSLETAGLVTTSGAPELRHHVPDEDAVAVHRALEAGAIVLGKTNLPIYAGDWQTYNAVYGRTNNPWGLARTVGGSSGGAAAASAAGFVPLEIGSDIGGSIRTPAHYCGVYGHKPSHGIVPGRGHIPGPPGTKSEADLAVVGPLARTAGDLQLALDVIAGPDALMREGWSLSLPASRAERLSELRVGYWLDDPLCPIDASVRYELEATIEALRPQVKLVDIGAPLQLERIVPLYVRLLLGVIGGDMPLPLRAMGRILSPLYALADRLGIETDLVTKSAVRGMLQSHSDWNRANEGRTKLRWQCRELFQDIDVLLTPIVPVTAFPHQTGGNHLSRRLTVNGEKRPYMDHVCWVALASAAFLPATSAPVGVTPEGLPVNIQIVGPFLGDKTTIRFAELLAELRGGFRPPPLLGR
ncbi:MAG: amidase [Deltaproteobacteria bacterium]|nr:MAG: amidase [Deltaproteobacteria bacterium]